MPCLVIVIALLAPRMLMFFIWLLTPWLGQAYKTPLWPVLGFIFMPYTTLAYMGAMLRNDGVVSGGWLLLLIIAILVDLGHLAGGGHSVRRR